MFSFKFVKELLNHSRYKQRWSPREHILKSFALASKVKSLALALASRSQVLENWPVLGSRTALFFELLKFCGAPEKSFGKHFFVEIACACVLGPWPWPRIFFCVLGLGLEPCVLNSTSCNKASISIIIRYAAHAFAKQWAITVGIVRRMHYYEQCKNTSVTLGHNSFLA